MTSTDTLRVLDPRGCVMSASDSTPPGTLPETKVVRIRRRNNKIIQDCDIYIGRRCFNGGWQLPTSKWHNPFPTSKYTREESIRLYREYIVDRPDLLRSLPLLRGKTLGCWCKPLACHGDVLKELCAANVQAAHTLKKIH